MISAPKVVWAYACSTLCRHGLRTSGRGVYLTPRCATSSGDGLDTVAGACSTGEVCK